jgi:hypothetical protein
LTSISIVFFVVVTLDDDIGGGGVNTSPIIAELVAIRAEIKLIFSAKCIECSII